MLHHVSVGVADVERAARFYDTVLSALGYRRVMEFLPYGIGYGDTRPTFWIQLPGDQKQASAGNGTHLGFMASTKKAVHAFHDMALKAGGRDNGAPGPRPDYGPDYYGAFVVDLDGNKLEAVLTPPQKPKAKPKTRKAAKSKAGSKRAAAKRKPAGRKSPGRRPARKARKR